MHVYILSSYFFLIKQDVAKEILLGPETIYVMHIILICNAFSDAFTFT